MQPILFTIPWLDIPVYGYGAMLGLSFLVGWYAAIWLAKWYGLNEDFLYKAMALAIVGSIVGARLTYVLTAFDESWSFARIFNIREGGLVAYGGYIGGVGLGVAYFNWKKLLVWRYLDVVTPMLAVGLGLTRIGCFLRGCCYGIRSDCPLSISFPPGSLVVQQHQHRGWPLGVDGWSLPVLPTQLFESCVGFILAGLAFWLLANRRKDLKKKAESLKTGLLHRDGTVFLCFVTLYSLWRFTIEFFRDDTGRGTIAGLSTSQFIALVLVAVCLFFATYWIPRHPVQASPDKPGLAATKAKGKVKKKKNAKAGRRR